MQFGIQGHLILRKDDIVINRHSGLTFVIESVGKYTSSEQPNILNDSTLVSYANADRSQVFVMQYYEFVKNFKKV